MVYEHFIREYQPKIDRAIAERMSPQMQIESGIYMHDVVCFDSKVPLLRLSASAYVACVSLDTADKLILREWGIKKGDELGKRLPGPLVGCWPSWLVHHDGEDNKPSESTMIKNTRMMLAEMSDAFAWEPITVDPNDKKGYLLMSAGGKISEDESMRIAEMLEGLEYVRAVEPGGMACV